ncbi:MAG: hypothetical protein JRI87_09145 [Deltaproteobacteria bacterium]|nr:hypothetical protein [Deltaproteobacteria bacterium]
MLCFTIGTDPTQWSEKGDGVEFLVQVKDGTRLDKSFHKYINPKNNHKDRRWFFEEIDLTPYEGKEIKIIFTVKAGPNNDNSHDRCGFADIEMVPKSNGKQKLSLVYNKEVKIYRNNTVMPRAFIVHRAEKIFQQEKILARLRDTHFDFRKTIIRTSLRKRYCVTVPPSLIIHSSRSLTTNQIVFILKPLWKMMDFWS